MTKGLLQWPDFLGIGVSLGIMLLIGYFCAKRNKSSETYFLAGRNMPGWVVGLSLMATLVSSMTFLATPGFTYENNWMYFPGNLAYLIAIVLALVLFMPFFRRSYITSAYEYLERRFGIWARLYAGTGFVLFQFFRTGIILYALSLSINIMTGWPIHWIIIVTGVIVAIYTIAGGLEAVIWTDVVQGLVLMIGAFICLPLIIMKLPGGFSQIIETGVANDKFSLGDTSLQFNKETVWVIMLTHIFFYSQMLCSDQSSVQRYCAMRSDRDAKQGLLVGAFATLPVWIFFTFIGTALFVFYMVFPTSELQNIESEQILPYFILTQLPAGVSGFILAGLFAAAMSTLDSGINAAAATITTDFYRRLCVKEQTEHHYLTAGRWFSVFLAVAMVLMALLIHFKRDVPLVTLQQLFFAIISGGLLGLFLLGFLTKRVDSISALIATICTTIIISVWLALRSKWGINAFPSLAEIMPHEFWINVLGNIFLFVLGYMVAFISGRFSRKNLRQLTVWTVDKNE